MANDDAGWSDYIELPDLPPTDPPATDAAPAAATSPPSTTADETATVARTVLGAGASAAASSGGSSPGRGRAPGPLLAIGAAIVVVVIVVVIVATRGGGHSRTTTSTTVASATKSNAAWVASANAVCTKYRAPLVDASARSDVDTLTTLGQQELDALRALGPSPSDPVASTKMIDFLDQGVNDLRNGDFVSFQGAVTSATAQAAVLGLTECVGTASR